MKAHRVVRFLIPILVAVVLGPLVAGLAVSLFAAANNVFGDTAGALSLLDLFALSGVYILFAYILGGVIALIAGLLVAVWMIWRPPSALVANAAAVAATALFMSVGATGTLGPVLETDGRSNFLFTLLLAVIAANACWLLMRRFAPTAASEAH
jgi:hypothetical protein